MISYTFVFCALMAGYISDLPFCTKLNTLLTAPISMLVIIAIDIAKRQKG